MLSYNYNMTLKRYLYIQGLFIRGKTTITNYYY